MIPVLLATQMELSGGGTAFVMLPVLFFTLIVPLLVWLQKGILAMISISGAGGLLNLFFWIGLALGTDLDETPVGAELNRLIMSMVVYLLVWSLGGMLVVLGMLFQIRESDTTRVRPDLLPVRWWWSLPGTSITTLVFLVVGGLFIQYGWHLKVSLLLVVMFSLFLTLLLMILAVSLAPRRVLRWVFDENHLTQANLSLEEARWLCSLIAVVLALLGGMIVVTAPYILS